jgi:hypothetical protein
MFIMARCLVRGSRQPEEVRSGSYPTETAGSSRITKWFAGYLRIDYLVLRFHQLTCRNSAVSHGRTPKREKAISKLLVSPGSLTSLYEQNSKRLVSPINDPSAMQRRSGVGFSKKRQDPPTQRGD